MSGDVVDTPLVEVTEDLVETLIRRGGYTHPLFNPSKQGQAGGETPPLPGTAVLLLMGGLVEQSAALGHAIAMVGLENVRFVRMVRVGASISVRLSRSGSRRTSSGKVIDHYKWLARDGDGETLVEATAVMLMDNEEGAQ